ncbi:MAG: DUF7146 domain-containing protein [Caulobacteraceae bacterium]
MSGLHITPTSVEALARQCFGEPNKRLSTAREMRFGRRGSISVVPARAVFADHEAGAAGGVLQMAVHAGLARSTAEAARLRETDGLIAARETFAEGRERARRDDDTRKAKRALAARIWACARPLAGSIAETYLRQARAIAAPLAGAMLRFDPGRAPWPPAMVAAVVDAKGDLTGAHRTFLAVDGMGKAEVAMTRQSQGEIMGGFIRLAPGSRLIVAEGIESALSAWEARPSETSDCGAVAAISAGGMAGLVWAAEVRQLIIAPDRDASGAGERAAQTLARRAYAAGLAVGFLRPPEGLGDWNDWARAQRGGS